MESRLQIEPLVCIALAFGLLLLPLKFVLAWIVATIVHEMSHICILKILGRRIFAIKFSFTGAVIVTDYMSSVDELLCAIAGPIGSVALMIFSQYIPVISFCGLLQGLYNLIPVYPMDGGRVIKCAIRLFFTEEATNKLCLCIEVCVKAALVLIGIYFFLFCHTGSALILVACIFAVKAGKIPCKTLLKRVQ